MISKQQSLAKVLRNDPYAFARKVFGTIEPGATFLPNWHLNSIAYHLMLFDQGIIKKLAINIHPRSLKTLMCNVAYSAWVLGRNPDLHVVCASHGQDLSRKHHSFFRAVVTSGWYKKVFPRMAVSSNTDTEVVTTRFGGRYATSVGGPFTGRGCDILILDDIQQPDDVLSDVARGRAPEWFDGTAMQRFNDPANPRVLVLTQRLHVDDFTAHIMAQSGWTILNLPAMTEIDREVIIGPGKLHKWPAGEALHPARLSVAQLMERKANLQGPHVLFFAAQFMGMPAPWGGALIKREWFKYYKTAPTRQPGDTIVVSWDTAYKTGKRNNFSVGLTFLCRGDEYYLIDVQRCRLEYPDLKAKIQTHALQVNADLVLIEEAALGAALITDLKRAGMIKPIAIKPTGDKQERVIRQIAPLASGQVILPESAPWLAEFLGEILAFPGGAYDDQVDALSQFLEWMESMRRKVVKQIKLGLPINVGGTISPLGELQSPTLTHFPTLGSR